MASKPKPAPRLQFTDEERTESTLEKPIRKAEKAADQREAAQSKLPTKRTVVREKTTDTATGKPVTRLRFEETARKPPATPKHPITGRINAEADRLISEYEEDNTGLQAVHTASQAGQSALRMGESAYHSHQLRQYRKAEKTEEKLDQANRKYPLAKARQENPQPMSNPISRWQQKRARFRRNMRRSREDAYRMLLFGRSIILPGICVPKGSPGRKERPAC